MHCSFATREAQAQRHCCMQGAYYSCFATYMCCDLLKANQVYISTSKPRTRLDFNTLCARNESLNSCGICRTECAPHASFTALGSECHKPFLHVANTMKALQFCDQGGASLATLLHAWRILFLSATYMCCDLLKANQVCISTSKPRTKLDLNTL